MCYSVPARAQAFGIYDRRSPLTDSHYTSTVLYVKRGEETPLGGDEGTRTPDLLRAREALSHLSYIPRCVGLPGLEPGTTPLSEECSNRLSYRPV